MATQKQYEILGYKNGSRPESPDALKKAYRELTKKNHPDKNKEPGAEERFKEINTAYEAVLSEIEIASKDIYSTGGKYGQAYFPAPDYGTDIDLTEQFELEDFLEERWVKVTYKQKVICYSCKGIGCEKCTDGRLTEESSIPFKMPPNQLPGHTIKMIGYGHHGNVKNGDLNILLRMKPHPLYSYSGTNGHRLYTKIRVPLWHLISRPELTVKTPQGPKTISLQSLSINQLGDIEGRIFVIHDCGWPDLSKSESGKKVYHGMQVRVMVKEDDADSEFTKYCLRALTIFRKLAAKRFERELTQEHEQGLRI